MKRRNTLSLTTLACLSAIVGLSLLFARSNASSSSDISPTPSLMPGTIAKDNSDIEMVYVPSGSFEMGISPEDASIFCEANNLAEDCLAHSLDQYKAHAVTLPSFWIDRYEVTVQHYQRCVDAQVCQPIVLSWMPTANDNPQKPIVGATWYEALEFCTWRGARLPTEQEWEYAASGPLNYSLPWGGYIV